MRKWLGFSLIIFEKIESEVELETEERVEENGTG